MDNEQLKKLLQDQQDTIKTKIQAEGKRLRGGVEEIKMDSAYWGGYDAALNWILGRMEK